MIIVVAYFACETESKKKIFSIFSSRNNYLTGNKSNSEYLLFRPLKMRKNFVFGICFGFFSTQNQVPQIIIRLGLVIYHHEALSVVIRTTLKNFPKKFASVEKHRFEVFDFRSNFEQIWRERVGLEAELCLI